MPLAKPYALNRRMRILGGLILILMLGSTPAALAQTLLVSDGQGRAEIVIAPKSSPTTVLAAHELQAYLKKVSGATLEIVHRPSDRVPNEIYVGHSRFTQKLGVRDLNLIHGGFQMKSGDHWLALVGNDEQWHPPTPAAYPLSYTQAKRGSGSAWKAFRRLSGIDYVGHIGGINQTYKTHFHHFGSNQAMNFEGIEFWGPDHRGSLNAVNQFLRTLGVRWYMQGELGEVVPQKRSIVLPAKWDRVVRAQFKQRMNEGFRTHGNLWYYRLGLNMGTEAMGPIFAHGLRALVETEKLKKEHPEYYAIIGGRRRNGKQRPKPDLSSPGLFNLTVRYVNAIFDIYDVPTTSVMPVDAYIHMPEGPRNKGKDTPERGYQGAMSDYVWGFVNRVAKEVYKKHPDKYVTNEAYNTYVLPPEKIDQLSPNLLVGLKNINRKFAQGPSAARKMKRLAKAWKAKTPNNLWFSEGYPRTRRGFYLPAYFPHAIAKGLAFKQSLNKGISPGDRVGISAGESQGLGHGLDRAGFNHLNVWVTARLYWSADPMKDVDKLLNDYYHKFYGPAADQMKAFVNYCESHWTDLEGSIREAKRKKAVAEIDKIFSLLHAAQAAVEPDSKYGKRIALVADYLQKLRYRGEQLGRGRTDVREVKLRNRRDKNVTLDGKFDEPTWKDLRAHHLQQVQTEDSSEIETTFRMFWNREDQSFYVGIHCAEPDMEHLNIKATKDGQTSIWTGAEIELEIETQANSYYQICVSPAGALVDLNRQGGGKNMSWSSEAEVATHRGDDAWQVEMRLPITNTNSTDDPLHLMLGTKPRETYPWFFNIGRQRVRHGHKQLFTFTGSSFHDVNDFAKLYANR